MHKKKNNGSGFTIVELLIVVVIIAILAAISMVAYANIQGRARDSKRVSDIAQIVRVLEAYKVVRGRYPQAQGNPGINAWEASVDPDFLSSLSSVATAIPVDPLNTTSHYYAYFRYNAGQNNCPLSAGPYYVLRIVGLESTSGLAISDRGVCASATGDSRTPSETQAVFFGFEN